MLNICPLFKNSSCLLKDNFKKTSLKKLFEIEIIDNIYSTNCNGAIDKCFLSSEIKLEESKQNIEKEVIEDNASFNTKVSIHLYENPYLIKADVLVYPSNNVLMIDDPLLNRMSRGAIQQELDQIPKPIKMGNVYVSKSGNSNTQVQPKTIYHAVVAGESRLVNEEDIKTSIRKCLHLALNNKVKNIVMLPPDCGTLDINDTARVHLSAIKTFLQIEKSCDLKNIFIVMSDQDSFDVYENYYKRIFK